MTSNVVAEDYLPNDEYETVSKAAPRSYEIVYRNLIIILYFHLAGLYGIYLGFTSAMWSTVIFSYILFLLGTVGVIPGAHRLWTHRSYKARTPLQIFLMLCFCITNQYSIIIWARDHRLHHKFSDTDADPHNANRGFFFSHVGWLMVRKHPEVIKRGKTIDVSDLWRNRVVRFQHQNRNWFIPVIGVLLPTIIPMHFWGETFSNSWYLNWAKHIVIMNLTFTINSVSHKWGYRPFDKSIGATQNKLFFYMTMGEGYHNYHHVFPCDYRSDEFGSAFNFMSHFIDACAHLGLAYDLKTTALDLVKARVKRTGDMSHPWAAAD